MAASLIAASGPWLRRAAALLAAALAAGTAYAEQNAESTGWRQNVYCQKSLAFADAMLAHARDEYGVEHSSLFAATLELPAMRMPGAASNRTRDLYAKLFRCDDFATSANPLFDTDFHQLLDLLSQLTGDEQYRRAGRDAIGWFFTHAQSPATGLVAWGEHLGWDLVEDRVTVGAPDKQGRFQVSDIHEFYGPWTHWDATFAAAPAAAQRFARGLWEHQIKDHATCRFSRHAHYSRHGPGEGYEFARDAGFYISTWAAAYAHTQDPTMAEAVDRMLSAYQGWRSPKTGLIPFETRSPQVVFVLNNLSFLVDCGAAAPRLPTPLGQRMQAFLGELDAAVLRLRHELGLGGRGFAKIVDAAGGEATNRGMAQARPSYSAEQIEHRYAPYGGLWGSEYGAASYTDARHGLLCYYRFLQTSKPEYRALTVAVADRYLNELPDYKTAALAPKTLAPPMAVLHAAFRLTGDRKYLEQSRRMADLAVAQLFRPATPLPYATQWKDKYPYYASVSHPGSLMVMFLELGLLLSGQDEPRAQCSIR